MERRYPVVGLPDTGKSTFLAALWHAVNAGEHECAMELAETPVDASHLNTLVKVWQECRRQARTSTAQLRLSTVRLRSKASGDVFALTFPDAAGEEFERYVATRSCEPEFLESFRDCEGLLLFVTADRRWDDISVREEQIFTQAAGGAENPKPEERKPGPWSMKELPEQVKLVELLQFFNEAPFSRMQRRVAIVVSAWDVLDALPPPKSPRRWLAEVMPLLWQYFVNSGDLFEWEVFGVSAQGGAFDDQVTREALAARMPRERLRCVQGDAVAHSADVSRVVAWLAEGEKAGE